MHVCASWRLDQEEPAGLWLAIVSGFVYTTSLSSIEYPTLSGQSVSKLGCNHMGSDGCYEFILPWLCIPKAVL